MVVPDKSDADATLCKTREMKKNEGAEEGKTQNAAVLIQKP